MSFLKSFKSLKNEKGSAILLAIFTVSFVIFLATEVSQQTIMEYLVSASEVKKVQARTTAQACLRLNLLRIKAYQQATNALGDAIPDMSMLDMIWSFPLSWPPTLPKDISGFDTSTINKTVGGSLLKNQFISDIRAEGGKIDLNDLGSPSESLRNKTKQQLLQRLQARVLNGDDSFSERYANFNFEELINNIADWIDEDKDSLNGGGEKSYYSEIQNDFIPPNRPFKTAEEIHMVAGMTDEIYDIIIPQVTLYGVKGINVNQADRDVLLSLFNNYDVQVSNEVVTEILKRRSTPELGGPFKDEKEFISFLNGYIDAQSFNEDENKVPLFFGAELNFRINCIGISGKMTTEIEAVVYDADSVKIRLQEALISDQKDTGNKNNCSKDLQGDALLACLCEDKNDAEEKRQCMEQKKKETSQDQSNKKKQPLPPGPPRIIFQRMK
jgi:general secretion pathway protein K